jgi:uncharacterized membrane protein YhhN
VTNMLILAAIIFAIGHWISIYKSYLPGQVVTKTLVMVSLLVWLYLVTGFSGVSRFFGAAVIFCLVGDILLLAGEKMKFFLLGLGAFLLGHIFFVIGFNIPLQPFSFMGIALAVMIALLSGRIYKHIAAGLAVSGELRLKIPVLAYTVAISLMLLSAMQTIFNPEWKTNASLLVTLGAACFMLSDSILAHNRFVTPIPNGRLYNMIAYHAGQIMLIAGIGIQYAK